jgi:hypothetical protein
VSRRRALPRALTLPSGRRVELSAHDQAAPDDRPTTPRALFDDAVAAFETGRVTLRVASDETLDIGDLPLADFHTLRAVLTRAGVLREEPVEITCGNCGRELRASPCRDLEIAPFVDGELDDPELDHTEPFDAPLEVAPILVGRVRQARTVTLAPRTVRDAERLFSWAISPWSPLDATVVEALGLRAIGDVTEPERLAQVLTDANDAAKRGFAEAWHAAHYPPRLSAYAPCETCGARATVDAPYDRELTPWLDAAPPEAPARAFVSAETFAERAMEMADALVARLPEAARSVAVVIEDGTPDVDEGGVPLMGGYLPASDASHGTVSVYYRTFRAMWNEEGPYDWEDELRETIEHELEHHAAFLRGHDEVDDDEREAIRDEEARAVGIRESARRARDEARGSARDFWRSTWPLWALVLAATVYTCATNR